MLNRIAAVAIMIVFGTYHAFPGVSQADVEPLEGRTAHEGSDNDHEKPSFIDSVRLMFQGGRWARYSTGGLFIGVGPTMSPDGKLVVYASPRTGRGDLYRISRDGTGRTQLTSDREYEGDPAYSPDGKQIAFIREQQQVAKIWIMDADGRNDKQLTTGTAYDQSPSFSRDGASIAFTRHVTDWKFRPGTAASAETFVIKRDGTGLTRLTNNKEADFEPVFSPDGQHIAYHRGAKGIEVMDNSGAARRSLGSGSSPWFSSDGKTIVFISDSFGREISLMNTDGSNRRRVIREEYYLVHPTFTPDGQVLFFRMQSNGTGEICTVAVDGTQLRVIADTK